MNPAIRVERLSKRYQVGALPAGFANLSQSLKSAARGTYSKLKNLAMPGTGLAGCDDYWALRDVSFEVARGEVVGIVGRNGAGKSTLLKLLSRITTPTSGRIEVRGRMGSLLEVGTGFHPELTGRENVYLNGSILGMTRREITTKFDQIVEFSEIGKFLDTPVKRYSSGMYVRLAFAVAAHLEPDILIVDEVLAVGDATFQRRCIDRMSELARSGHTILFVSHNMQLIPRLCDRAVLLQKGVVVEVGSADAVTQHYLDRLLEDARGGDLRTKPRIGDGRARFVRAEVLGPDSRPVSVFTSGDDFHVRIDLESTLDLSEVTLAVAVQSLHGTRIVSGWTREAGFVTGLAQGMQTFECCLSRAEIRPGQTILVNLTAATEAGVLLDEVEAAIVLDVVGDERHTHLSTNPDQGVWVTAQSWRRVS